jgi:hypothetical protein
LAKLCQRDVQSSAGVIVVGRLVEQPRNPPEGLLRQREHRAATRRIIHRPQRGDHG